MGETTHPHGISPTLIQLAPELLALPEKVFVLGSKLFSRPGNYFRSSQLFSDEQIALGQAQNSSVFGEPLAIAVQLVPLGHSDCFPASGDSTRRHNVHLLQFLVASQTLQQARIVLLHPHCRRVLLT